MNIFNIWTVSVILSVGMMGESLTQEPFVTYPSKFEDHLRRLHDSSLGELAFNEKTTKDVKTWRKTGRKKMTELLGLSRMAQELKDFKPTVTLSEPEDVGDHTRQKGEILTEPGIRIPFWLLKPKADPGSSGKYPLAICSHGHDTNGMNTYAGVWQNEAHQKRTVTNGGPVGIQAVKRGYIALIPATRGLAKDSSIPDLKGRHGKRECRSQLIHALLVGRTAVGERVWDIQRLLDWALKCPDIDSKRVLMLGNSGGGVLTLNSAAVDERIKVAVPSCSFTSYTSKEGFIFHCDCCLIPRVQREFGDMSDVGGLISPRALLAVNGKKDGLHSFPDVERAMAHVKTIYTAAGVAQKFDHQWGSEGHRFYPDLMWPFIEKWIDPRSDVK